VLSIASSFPKHCFSSQELCDALIQNHYHNNLKEEDEHFVRHIFKRSLIERCHVSVPLDRAFVRMSRTEYTDHVKSSIERISVEAATTAFEQLERLYGLDRSCITHLVFGTMTGTIAAPSMDVQLSQKLGLSPFVQRLNIEAMGCLTGVRLTGLCQDLIGASKNKRVLLITCDIRSALGHTMPPFDPAEPFDRCQVITAALFRDGAAAAIIGHPPTATNSKQNLLVKVTEPPRFTILDHLSFLVPQSSHLAWLQEENDGAQRLYLDKALPKRVAEHLPTLVKGLAEKHGIDLSSCQFVIHPGGPRVLENVGATLSLQPEQMTASWYVMTHRGNLSGSSTLVVLHHLDLMLAGNLQCPETQHPKVVFPETFSQYTHVFGISFGPGVGVEMMLLKINM